jgi:flagellar hook-basal body complex protein FliE
METKAIGSIEGVKGIVSGASTRGPDTARAAEFLDVLKSALDQVNASQRASESLAQRFQLEDPTVSLEDVMIAMSKANIAFQAAVQVRNRLISAYHDIMNMQV